jgi:hypothetical protein
MIKAFVGDNILSQGCKWVTYKGKNFVAVALNAIHDENADLCLDVPQPHSGVLNTSSKNMRQSI